MSVSTVPSRADALRAALVRNDPEALRTALAAGARLPRPGCKHPVFEWLEQVRKASQENAREVLRLLLAAGLDPDFQVVVAPESRATRAFWASQPTWDSPTTSISVGAPLLDRLIHCGQSLAALHLLTATPEGHRRRVPAKPHNGPPPLWVAVQAQSAPVLEVLLAEDQARPSPKQKSPSKADIIELCHALVRWVGEVDRNDFVSVGALHRVAAWLGPQTSASTRLKLVCEHLSPISLDLWFQLFPSDAKEALSSDFLAPPPSKSRASIWSLLFDRLLLLGDRDPVWQNFLAQAARYPKTLGHQAGSIFYHPAVRPAAARKLKMAPLDFLVLVSAIRFDGEGAETEKTRAAKNHLACAIDALLALGATPFPAEHAPPSYAQLLAQRRHGSVFNSDGSLLSAPDWWRRHPSWIAPDAAGRTALHELEDASDLDYWCLAGVDPTARDHQGHSAFAELFSRVVNVAKDESGTPRSLRLQEAALSRKLKEHPALLEHRNAQGARVADLACGSRELFRAAVALAASPSRAALVFAVEANTDQILHRLLAPPFSLDPSGSFNGLTLRGHLANVCYDRWPDVQGKRYGAAHAMNHRLAVAGVPLDPPNHPGAVLRFLLSKSFDTASFVADRLPDSVRCGVWGPADQWSQAALRALVFAQSTTGRADLGMAQPLPQDLWLPCVTFALSLARTSVDPFLFSLYSLSSKPNRQLLVLTDLIDAALHADLLRGSVAQDMSEEWLRVVAAMDRKDRKIMADPGMKALAARFDRVRLKITTLHPAPSASADRRLLRL